MSHPYTQGARLRKLTQLSSNDIIYHPVFTAAPAFVQPTAHRRSTSNISGSTSTSGPASARRPKRMISPQQPDYIKLIASFNQQYADRIPPTESPKAVQPAMKKARQSTKSVRKEQPRQPAAAQVSDQALNEEMARCEVERAKLQDVNNRISQRFADGAVKRYVPSFPARCDS